MVSGSAIIACYKSYEYKPVGGVVVRHHHKRTAFVRLRFKAATKFIKNNFNNASKIFESQGCIIASHIKAWTSKFFQNNLLVPLCVKNDFAINFGGVFLLSEVM